MAEKKELTPEEQIKALQDENKKLSDDLKKIGDESATKDELIKGLNEAIAEKDASAASNQKRPVIKVGKEQYALRFAKFTHNFNGRVMDVNREVLESNQELAEDLIKKESAALIPLKKKGGK
jgi:hypothetical protein